MVFPSGDHCRSEAGISARVQSTGFDIGSNNTGSFSGGFVKASWRPSGDHVGLRSSAWSFGQIGAHLSIRA